MTFYAFRVLEAIKDFNFDGVADAVDRGEYKRAFEILRFEMVPEKVVDLLEEIVNAELSQGPVL